MINLLYYFIILLFKFNHMQIQLITIIIVMPTWVKLKHIGVIGILKQSTTTYSYEIIVHIVALWGRFWNMEPLFRIQILAVWLKLTFYANIFNSVLYKLKKITTQWYSPHDYSLVTHRNNLNTLAGRRLETNLRGFIDGINVGIIDSRENY